ncbi:hypothetical protein [Modestobacter italicus]|uniref:hypothetical protein n=1 Tax=Modestobacter italicus (strain DSM 44449 / CECT 9708 / BC 501) TaxID=2732864 RepID=UPI001C9509B0|nr:hypothetical protein [Modestobacter italicus]
MTPPEYHPATTSPSSEPASLIAVRQLAAERRQFRGSDDRLVSAARIRAARRRDALGQDDAGQ